MTSKATTRKTTPATPATPATAIDAVYALKGRGKTRTYFAQFPEGITAAKGADVILHTSYKGHQRGTLIEMVGKGDGMQVWTFDRVRLSPEETAENNRLKALHQAEYWQSDKGQQTAEKIAQRQAAAAAKVAPVDQVTAAVQTAAAPAAPTTMDRVSMIAELKAAGFTIAEIMAHLATEAPAPAAPAPAAPAAPAPTIRSRRLPGAAQTMAAPTVISTSNKARVDCPSCGKHVDKLYHHAGAKVDVCNPCMSLDGETVKLRIARKTK